jgi:hypothetical protein
MATKAQHDPDLPVSPGLLAVRDALGKKGKTLTTFVAGDLVVELRTNPDALWAIIRRSGSSGGLAMRTSLPGPDTEFEPLKPDPGDTARIRISNGLGVQEVAFRLRNEEHASLQIISRFTPTADTSLPFVPRDLFALGAVDEPLAAEGKVEAAQRGLNSGLVYFQLERPGFGNILYFQNLTSLNDYCRATDTKPEDAVGGIWPELGFLLPTPPQRGTPEPKLLTAGREFILSDAVLVLRPDLPSDERDSARHFLQMLGTAYKSLDLPAVEYRDWIGRAERTLRDLDAAPEATIRHYGHRYIHPYTAAEYPDAMVQMSIVSALHDWGQWSGEPHPLESEFMAGMGRFYDRKLGTIRRYLPNVGDDKDADAVDSWYLYHPLLNLGRLALKGNTKAKQLFMGSLDYGISAAHHFGYKWPVQYKVIDFTVITETAEADGRGQTDVGGVYAWVMLEAFELTDDKRYLDEAVAAIDTAIGLGFALNYQANLTAWGAAACMRLWRITNRDVYLAQSYVYLASFFHNCEIWESRLGHAVHYSNFLGVTCLQDAPYMAIYECFDSFTAFERYLDDSGPDLEPAARMLIAEYCRYALHRAIYYYPDELPREVVATEQRENNGHVDRNLSFPLEDLYPDGQPAGQVGQEIYGAGAAFIFATRAFHHVEDAPFLLYCDHFVRAIERTEAKTLVVTLDGGETCTAGLSLVRRKRRKLPRARISAIDGDVLRPHEESADRVGYLVPANGRLLIKWE